MSLARLTESGTPFEAHLLRAARSEAPPTDRKAQTLALVGAAAIVTASAPLLSEPAAAGAAKTGLSPYWRMAFGCAGLGLGLLAVFLMGPSESRLGDEPATSLSPSTTDLVTPSILTPSRRSQAPRSPQPRGVPSARAVTQTATARAETASEEEAERPDDLALLRHARRALAHGEPRSAFEDLDALARSFPKTLYAEEAAALRIEALATVGDVTAARALADRFHVHYPASPYAHRVRSLAGR